ncbi:MAG: ABC transporter permease [Flavobacteriales bacterium]|nr:ABC transporter permease [Flavobacteriales bacterium]
MKAEFFIARRIIRGGDNKSRLSRPIVVISLASIILGLAIMIITVSVVTGFQKGIRDKVIGFGSHIQVTDLYASSNIESSPILINQEFYPSLEEDENVKKIQPVGYKPGILQSSRDSVAFDLGTHDTVTSSIDLLGVLFKGIDENYDWSFFEDKLVEGELIDFESSNNEVIISKYISEKMGYKIGDEIQAFFIKERPTPRTFKIVGIYRTGFEEFDQKFIYTQLSQIQKLNNWGVQTFLTLADTCDGDEYVLRGVTRGGSNLYKYNWGTDYIERDYFLLEGKINETIQMTARDHDWEISGMAIEPNSVPDTAWATIQIDSACACSEEILAKSPIQRIGDSLIIAPFGSIQIKNGIGTHHLYAGGFEVLIHEWEDLEEMDEIIYHQIPAEFDTVKITELHPDIFAWLDFLDLNIAIVIGLILIVSLINMITSLLVMILEKTNMIGIMKALGAKNRSIRKIFLYHAMFLLSRGLLWGNILGIGLLLFQHYTNIFSLNPDVYYLETVPVNFNLLHILYINLLTLIVCRFILIVPSYLVSRIDPTKAIKFD